MTTRRPAWRLAASRPRSGRHSVFSSMARSARSTARPWAAAAFICLRADPSRYLLGIYASHHSWDSIDISRLPLKPNCIWVA